MPEQLDEEDDKGDMKTANNERSYTHMKITRILSFWQSSIISTISWYSPCTGAVNLPEVKQPLK